MLESRQTGIRAMRSLGFILFSEFNLVGKVGLRTTSFDLSTRLESGRGSWGWKIVDGS